MRQIEIEDGLRVRFPGRSEEFDQGVEIGMLAVLMSAVGGEFERRVATANLDQARSLAEKLGYHLSVGGSHDGMTEVVFKTGRTRPKLTLAYSRADAEPRAAAPALDGGPARRSAPTLVSLMDVSAVS